MLTLICSWHNYHRASAPQVLTEPQWIHDVLSDDICEEFMEPQGTERPFFQRKLLIKSILIEAIVGEEESFRQEHLGLGQQLREQGAC